MRDIALLNGIQLKTEFGEFGIRLDIENKALKIDIPDDFKIMIGGDLTLETDGEINLLTHGKDVNIDSLDAFIWFNSYKCKQIRDIPEMVDRRNAQIEQRKKEREEQKNKTCPQMADMLELFGQLSERISRLENLEERTIDIGETSDIAMIKRKIERGLEHDED